MKSIKLGSIISKKVEQLQESNTFKDALEYMKELAISSVVITDNKKPIGIFTESDGLKAIANKTATKTKLSDIMSKELHCMNEETSTHDAYIFMEKNSIRHLIVIDDDGSYSGVVTEGDFLRHSNYKDVAK